MNTPVVENLVLEELPRTADNRGSGSTLPRDIDLIKHVQIALTATLGTAEISVEKLFSLCEGDVVTLRELVNEPVTLLIENRPVARGQIVAVDDHFGVEVTEILPR